MKYAIILCFIFLFTDLSGQLLIKNVNVLDVENKKVLNGYDVVVIKDRIVSVHKDKMYKLPPGTAVIDGTGKWLSPGFVDAHVHFFQSGGLYARPDAIDLRKYQPYDKELKFVHDNMNDMLDRYLASGITSVIDVGASFNFLQQRDSLALRPSSPIVSMTGPLLTTYLPAQYRDLGDESPFALMYSKEDAIRFVHEQLKNKADFIKIWYIVLDTNAEAGARKNYDFVKAAIDEAHRNHKRVAVHATERITAQLAVEAGADFLVHSVDDQIVNNEFVKLLKQKNVVVCPTLIVSKNYEKVLSDNYHFNTYELNNADPFVISTIIDYPWPDTAAGKNRISRLQRLNRTGKPGHSDTVMAINLKKLIDGGVTIATGTDAGNIGTQHVTSYFNELHKMQAAGLTTWQLLQASTINGAKVIGQEKNWGSVETGKLANLILLNANPLDSISNWKKIALIINKGMQFRPDTIVSYQPVDLVQQQLNAYNAHDLDAFLEPYADDVEIYSTSGKSMMKGKEEMRKRYQFVTRTPHLYCRLVNRIVSGNTVIDHEEIWTRPEPAGLRYGVAIYVIDNKKIKRVYFND